MTSFDGALAPAPFVARTKRAGAVVERFHAYLQTPSARAIFERYGFTLPK